MVKIDDETKRPKYEELRFRECRDMLAYALKAYPSEFPQDILEKIEHKAWLLRYALSVQKNDRILPEERLARRLSNFLWFAGTGDAFNDCISLLDRVIRLSARKWHSSTFDSVIGDLNSKIGKYSHVYSYVNRSLQSLHLLLETTGRPLPSFCQTELHSIQWDYPTYHEIDDLKGALLNLDKVLKQDELNHSKKGT